MTQGGLAHEIVENSTSLSDKDQVNLFDATRSWLRGHYKEQWKSQLGDRASYVEEDLEALTGPSFEFLEETQVGRSRAGSGVQTMYEKYETCDASKATGLRLYHTSVPDSRYCHGDIIEFSKLEPHVPSEEELLFKELRSDESSKASESKGFRQASTATKG